MPSEQTPDPLIRAIERTYSRGPAPEPERLAAVLRNLERAATREQPVRRARWFPWLLAGAVAAAAAAGGWRWYAQPHAADVTGQTAAPARAEPHSVAPLRGGESEAGTTRHSTEAPSTDGTRGSGKGQIIFMH